jgi:outer membrane protein OmpA-like peptidoglycan-associated protein
MKPSQNRRFPLRTMLLPAGIFVTTVGLACATATPSELTNARTAYSRASAGPAAQFTPSDLHKAKTALDVAERSFVEDEDSRKTADLAYIAERTAQLAEARAQTAIAEKSGSTAKLEVDATQAAMAKKTEGALAKTREQLNEVERAQAAQAVQSGVDRAAREEADKKAAASEQRAVAADAKTKEANDALAKLAAKEEERGMVITLSGSVLFRSNDAALLPGAQTRLDQVAEALVAKGRDVVIEGHTDSRGSQATNMGLSQRRADSVRTYLVSRGFPSEKVLARGIGPDRPIAENKTAEGRANNRRVEIVIAKAPSAVGTSTTTTTTTTK